MNSTPRDLPLDQRIRLFEELRDSSAADQEPGLTAAENLLMDLGGYAGPQTSIESPYRVGAKVVDEPSPDLRVAPLGADGPELTPIRFGAQTLAEAGDQHLLFDAGRVIPELLPSSLRQLLQLRLPLCGQRPGNAACRL